MLYASNVGNLILFIILSVSNKYVSVKAYTKECLKKKVHFCEILLV